MKNITMDKVQLKSGIHSFIDQIESLDLLNDYYYELKRIIDSRKSNIWDSLSEEQKREILLSYEESEQEENLIDENVVMEKYNKWK
jgi:hypothetical protein